MSQLILKYFKCIERNDSDSDSPYFLVFNALGNNAEVHKIRDSHWDDAIDDGTEWKGQMEVPGSVAPQSLVLVALLEQDDGVDISGDEYDAVRRWMKKSWAPFAASGTGGASQGATKEMKRQFLRAINANTSNDDCIDIKRLPVPSSGGPVQLDMSGYDSGYYQVRFATE